MFVCEECIKNYDVDDPLDVFLMMGSHGPCEDCGKVRDCYDLPHDSYKPKGQDKRERYE